jgi:nitroreductase
MDRREMLKTAAALGLVLAVEADAAETDALLELPPPQREDGMPLMRALGQRSSSRAFSARKLPPQVLSNLLWAAFGVNRAASGGRTAPSAHGWQEIELWCALEEGLFVYEHKAHALRLAKRLDLRAQTGLQDFPAKAPLNLVFVADFARMGTGSVEEKTFYSAADTGFVSQNVYLCCAQEGLATVVRGWLDRPTLAGAMGLGSDHKVVLAQTVGYPG